MRCLDLFSGIGGFSLGFERAGIETIAFCEYDEHARKILKKHWPEIPIFNDVRELDGKQFRGSVDIVCGGFPCQDLSSAGRQDGINGERSGLYREMLRIIGECRPQFAVFENVSGLLTGESGRWFAKFLYDLASIGYDAEWHCIRASSVGLPHKRDRVWVIAYSNSIGLEGGSIGRKIRWPKQKVGVKTLVDYENGEAIPKPKFCGDYDGVSRKPHRLRRLGNAVVPQIPEAIGKAIIEWSKGNAQCTNRD